MAKKKTFSVICTMTATVDIQASSAKEATRLVEDMSTDDVFGETLDNGEWLATSVEEVKP